MPDPTNHSLLGVVLAVPLLLAGGSAMPQTTAPAAVPTTVYLTAMRMTGRLPDGNAVPMWGYCRQSVDPTTNQAAACAPNANWAPGPTIVVPTDSATGLGSLSVTLTNALPMNTSLVILGQIGTETGQHDAGTSLAPDVPRVASPPHSGQNAITWPATDPSAAFTPPTQGPRAVAFAAETAAGSARTYSWPKLRAGTYLYETGSMASLQAPMGLYGVLVVTHAPAAGAAGDAYPKAGATTARVGYDADATLLLSEIDPRQNAAVDTAAQAHADVTKLFNDPSCTAVVPCFPPVVNYAPTYFLINGLAFDPTAPSKSGFPFSGNLASPGGGQLLVRMVNAGLRMHVPSIAGLPAAGQLVAEDGNLAPGVPKQQSHFLMAAGKTLDVVVKSPTASVNGLATYSNASYPVFDRALSLTSGNLDHQTVLANSGMMGFLAMQPADAITGSGAGATVPAALLATANPDLFATAMNVSFNGNVLGNDVNVTTAAVQSPVSHGTLTLAADGSFVYVPSNGYVGVDSFTYVGNNNSTISATVTINVGTMSKPTAVADQFSSNVATLYRAAAPGVLANDSNGGSTGGLTAVLNAKGNCGSVSLQDDGSFSATPGAAATPGKPVTCSFTYHAVNVLGGASDPVAAAVTFLAGSGLQVAVQDAQDATAKGAVSDYGWVIEEDRTFLHDPAKPAATDTLATNFHRSYMPVVASGCTGTASCGDANSAGGTAVTPRTHSSPGDVVLDPTKRYYLSILPGDADQGDGQYDATGAATIGTFGHTMGGASIGAAQFTTLHVQVLVPRNPLPPSQLSVFVFEDNNPTNGGVDDNEPGLGGFTVNLYDTRGSSGDPAGLMTYDMSAMPFTNSLANQKDSATGVNLCPMNTPSGTIITCPALDARRQPSPLAGMALVKNINPGRYDVWATPGAERAAAGEEWIQVSTLEGTHANDTFIKPGEPPYWQEFGPPGFHSFIGFINPAHIAAVTRQQRGTATVTGRVPSLHMDRPRPTMASLNNSCASGTNADGSPVNAADPSCRATIASTVCYAAVNTNAGQGATVALATCDQNGNFTLKNVPPGQHELVIWDKWLDQIIAYKALTVPNTRNATVVAGDIPVFEWFTRVEQQVYQDLNGNGVRDANEPGVSQIPMNIRFRDGSISNFLSTDSSGNATANELFPLFNWYVLESDTTRYTGTGVLSVYDAGGKPDTTTMSVTDLNGRPVTKDYRGVLNSAEPYPLDTAHQVAGSTYSARKTARIDSGATLTEGAQGYINQTAVVEWGKRPYVPGENGGITGMVYYASTRGFDDPSLEVQFSWEPGIAGVVVNLYQEVKQSDGSVNRVLVDQTTTWSWDASAASLNCPGEPASGDPFVDVTLKGNYTKCYDGQHSFNQIQPAPYDGRYKFPSAACSVAHGTLNTVGGQTVQCVTQDNPANALANKPTSVNYPAVLPNGNYVVELVVPPGYEIVKEEDKNILIGDAYVAPYANTQFMGVGNIFILPDQATLNDANVPGGNLASAFPPCVGSQHLVPDYLSLFPANQQLSPYAGQTRPLCDHKEVGVTDQGQGGADFQLFTQTPIAGHISGIMLNDAAAEFDPYNPAFLEKASLPNAPISVRDYNGLEIQRVYNDRYGTFNNLVPSTWDANVPNPSGYAPNMLTFCMNDPGPILDTRQFLADGTTLNPTFNQLIVDPLYNPMFSNFCYNWPSMPGITTYLDTPVLPVSAYASASSYEPVDCAYPANTPAIFRADGNAVSRELGGGSHTGIGPVVDLDQPNATLTLKALGDVWVANPAYEGPNALPGPNKNPANQPKVLRHYGFGTTPGSVTVNGVAMTVAPGAWNDTQVVVSVPASATSGQLVITNAAGVASIDAVTVTMVNGSARNYRAPFYVAGPVAGVSGAGTLPHPIQDAIDQAQANDLIIVDAGNYSELVVMDRPVRLQGVGAAAVVINATKYPNQKLDQWRTRVNSLFGLDNQGNVLRGPAGTYPAVDPLPGQEITGGVLLLEPSVLSTEEGAGITVLAKEFRPNGQPLNSGGSDCGNVHNFRCGTARIDGVSVTGGDAGGGIYVNGWAHGLEISNNRVFGNAGPFAGGIRIGQPYLEGQTLSSGFTGFGYDENVLVHNNAITHNGTVEGNAAAGATAAAAGGAGGGLSICAGSDGYKVTGNWVCGNYSSSDGGGIGHIGLSNNGLIRGNRILFNESYNQSGPQHGGGLVIEGEGATGTTLTLGTGNVSVDQNLILGNFARAGSGGGIRLQSVNGGEVGVIGPRNQTTGWNVSVTNNMIVNNLAAWAGAGISLADTLFSKVENNTVASNDSTGIAGNLFSTQVPRSNGAAGGNTGPTTAVPNPAGISTELTSSALLNALPQGQRTANQLSDPHLVNDIVWHNRSFFFNMSGTNTSGATGLPQLSPSNSWYDSLLTAKPVLGAAGANGCTDGDKYWDLGAVGDTTAATNSMAAMAGNSIVSTSTVSPNLKQAYCNASRALPGLQFEPGTPFQPAFNMNVSATLDESGNFVDLHFGPLSLQDQASSTTFNGDYHLSAAGGSAYNTGSIPTQSNAAGHDYDGEKRPQGGRYDIGADEFSVKAPRAVFSSTALAFGSVALNTSKVQAVTLTNPGSDVLQITSIGTVSGPGFSNAPATNCGATLAINATCTISVTFAPKAAGSVSGSLAVVTNDPAAPTTQVTVSGRGVGVVSMAPSPLVFSTAVALGASASAPVTVSNATGASVTQIQISTGRRSDFSVPNAGNQCRNLVLAAGATCTFQVVFAPSVVGSRADSLQLFGLQQGQGLVTASDALSGTGK